MTDDPSEKTAPRFSEACLEKQQIGRRRILVKAIVLGALVGLFSSLFRLALNAVELARIALWHHSIENGFSSGLRLALFLAIGFFGAGTALWLVRRFSPEASGSGIPQVKSVVLGEKTFRWRTLLPIKFVSGVLGIGSGLALGREGPTIQMGGAIGQVVARLFRIPTRSGEYRVLVGAGASAGLAGAFNAPLSAMMFVLEEVYGTLTPVILVASFLASITADIVCQAVLGSAPVFRLDFVPAPTAWVLPPALLLGVLCGLVGIGFNKMLLSSLDLFDRFEKHPPFLLGGIVGLVVGFACWIRPEVGGTGTWITEDAIRALIPLRWILLLFVVRLFLTMVSYGSGAAGGIFTPILVLGALGGLALGKMLEIYVPCLAETPEIYAVIGMGALFTAVVRAPLTGIVLMIELTGEYGFMLPLLVASLTAYGIAEFFRVPPIYDALRIRGKTTDEQRNSP